MKVMIELEIEDSRTPYSDYKAQVLLNSLELVQVCPIDENFTRIKAKHRARYVRCTDCNKVVIRRKDGCPVRHGCP